MNQITQSQKTTGIAGIGAAIGAVRAGQGCPEKEPEIRLAISLLWKEVEELQGSLIRLYYKIKPVCCDPEPHPEECPRIASSEIGASIIRLADTVRSLKTGAELTINSIEL